MKRTRRPLLAALAVVALVVGSAVGIAAPAHAADGDVEVVKTVNATTVAPGQTFQYQIAVSCTSILAGCVNATLTDTVPGEFIVLGATVGTGLQGTVTITGQTVDVVFTHTVAGQNGLPAGTAGVVTIQVQVRDDLPYEASGVPVTNTATTDADTQTSGPLSSSVDVTPIIPLELATGTTKTMSPTSAVAVPGTPVTATITTTNDSNAEVETIVITDPADPTGVGNPFESLPFTGDVSVTYPAGAETAVVEVTTDGTTWTAGPTATAPAQPAPPAGIPNEDVIGVRITFTSTTGGGIPAGSSAAAEIGMEHGPDVQSSPENVTVTNTAEGEIGLDGETADDEAEATHEIIAENVEVLAIKDFEPNQVPAGGSSTATLTAGNESDFPLTEMTVTEPSIVGGDPFSDGFDESMQFDGFASGITYPAGATGATIVYYYEDGTQSAALPFANGAVPPAPTGTVVRFEITFTGNITPGAQTEIPFGVTTDPDQEGYPAELPNEFTVSGTGPIGGVATDTDDDILEVFEQHLETITSKSIYPDTIVDRPGEWVLVTLNGAMTPFPDSTVGADQIIVQDPVTDPYEGVDGTFWDEFDATAITETGVPPDAILSINYWDGDSWEPLPGFQDLEGAQIVSGPIPEDLQDDILGLQFVYDAKPGEEFEYAYEVEPHFTAEKRADERDDTTETTGPVENCGSSSASNGDLESTPTGDEIACDTVDVIDPDGGAGGGGPDVMDKEIEPNVLTSRSQQTAQAFLNWSTGGFSGVDQVVIQDEATPPAAATGAPMAGSFYDAFDLVGIPQITTAMDPWLQYDAITGVELWDGTAWRSLSNDPCATVCEGGFPGVVLEPADRAAAIGIRLTFVESPDRDDVIAGDPTAPPVGTGVARSSGNDRQVILDLQLRDNRRSDGAPAMGFLDYNVADTDPEIGTVLDVASTVGTDGGVQVIGSTDDDTIAIVDQPLNIDIVKTWSNSPFGVPPDEAVQENFPTGRMRIEAINRSVAKVDTLTIEDPSPDSPVTPEENPFTYFNAYDIRVVSIPAGADPALTEVVLHRDTDGDAVGDTFQTVTVSVALGMTSGELENVVGIQVLHEGRIDSNAVAVLELDVQLRKFLRNDPATRVTVDDSPVGNIALATIDDAGGAPSGSETSAEDDAEVELQEFELSVEATKTFTPDTQSELDPLTPVVMTLTGQPTGSLRTGGMRIEDSDPQFWNAFDYVGIDPSFQLTSPINLVRSQAYVGGDFAVAAGEVTLTGGAWIVGNWLTRDAFLANPLPAGVTPDQVQGIRFGFMDDDDGDAIDPQQWENPTDPLQAVPVLVQRRVDLRTGGPVPSDRADLDPAPGEDAPGEFTNEMSATVCSFLGACSPDLGGEVGISATDTAEDQMFFQHAETAASIVKTPTEGSAYPPDTNIPYQITVTNIGEWPIINPVIVDEYDEDQLRLDPELPADGLFAFELSGAAPTPPNGLAMPTDPEQITLTAVPGSFTFTFPEGTVLEVGQSYTISISMIFTFDVLGGDVVPNTATVSGDRPFDACSDGNGEVEGTFEECTAETEVVALAAGATRSGKIVRAADPADQAQFERFHTETGEPCDPVASPLIDPDDEGFSRFFCVPVARPGGPIEWRLAIANTGNIPMDRLVLTDRLPTVGDTGVLSGLARESEFTPVFDPDFGVELAQAPAGSTFSYEVTTGEVCTADMPDTLNPACPADAWVPYDPSIDPADITGIQVTIVLPPGSPLLPGEIVLVDFQTITPAVQPGYGEEPPVVNPVSWNSVATGAHLTEMQSSGTQNMTPIEGTKAGAALATGQLELLKTTSGAGEEFAPETFDVQLVCTSAVGTPVEEVLPPIDLTLTADEPVVVDGLPWGAECEIVEEDGANGQIDSSGSGGVVVSGGDPDTATLDNVYALASLELTKIVDDGGAVNQDGEPIEYGPFEASVDCTFLDEPVWGDGYTASPMLVELEADETVAITGLPAGAECVVTETDSDGASSITVNGETADGPIEPGDGTEITVVLTPDDDGDPTNSAVIENVFTIGSLELLKVIEPEDSVFAAGPYVAHVTCTLDGDITWEGDVFFDAPSDNPATIDDDTDFEATIDGIATGSMCSVVETDNAFAASSTVAPSSVVIGDGTVVTVTITNFFPEGSLTVTKELTGDTTWAPTSFTVRLTCLDPTTGALFLDIPDGPTRELTEANGYTASYDPLPAGALCVLIETDTGGADSTVIQDADGDRVGLFVVEEDVELSLTVVNDFVTGQLAVTKQTSGEGAGQWAAGTEFEIELSCTAVIDGVETVLEGDDIPGGAVRPITDGETVVYENLPPGAECTIVETDDVGASSVEITPNDGVDTTTGIATVDVDATEPLELVIDNTLDAGEIIVTKEVTGDAAQWGDDGEFTVVLGCTWDGTGTPEPVTVDEPERVLSAANDFTETYTGLPDGAVCELTETDAAGASSTVITPNSGDPLVGTVTVDAGATEPLEITVENVFDAGSLTVVKTVTGEAAEIGGAYIFVVELTCTESLQGAPTPITIPGGATRLLTAGNGYTATYSPLPMTAECELREVNPGGATDVTITPNSGDPLVGTVTIDEQTPTAQFDIENVFDAGSLRLVKVVDGEGADFFGDGPFTIHVTCTLETGATGIFASRTVVDEDVILLRDEEATIDGIPVGSVCEVEETDDSVADESTVDPSTVTIGEGEGGVSVVTITNTFLIGSVHVQKVVTGGGAEEFGAGPFEVTVRCIDPANRFRVVEIPGGAVRELTAANGYETTYEALPVGALCGIAETDDGGADAKRLLDENGAEIGLITLDSGSRVGFFRVQDGVERSFVLENTFDPPLPPTGLDLRVWSTVALFALLLTGVGFAFVLAGAQRRRADG